MSNNISNSACVRHSSKEINHDDKSYTSIDLQVYNTVLNKTVTDSNITIIFDIVLINNSSYDIRNLSINNSLLFMSKFYNMNVEITSNSNTVTILSYHDMCNGELLDSNSSYIEPNKSVRLVVKFCISKIYNCDCLSIPTKLNLYNNNLIIKGVIYKCHECININPVIIYTNLCEC